MNRSASGAERSSAAVASANDPCSSASTGAWPATRERQTTCAPATYVAGRVSSQAPSAPSRAAVARTEASTADRGRTTRLGVPVDPGSLFPYTVTIATIIAAVVLIFVGAIADRSPHPTRLFAGIAWTGALAASAMFFIAGTNWQLGIVSFILANLCFGASAVFNDAILPLISTEEERDRVSSRGWAYGYAGGGLLLAINFVVVSSPDTFGLDTAMAVRLSMLSAAVWWAAFTFIPWRGIRNRPPADVEQVTGGVLQRSFGQLWSTLKDLRNYPVALTFLLAYLFFNDGIQTVIGQASVYGVEELGFETGFVLGTIRFVLEVRNGMQPLEAAWAQGWVEINFLHYALLMFLLCTGVLVAVSLATPAPSRAQLAGLTFATATEGVAAEPVSAGLRRAAAFFSIALVVILMSLWFYLR